MKRKEKPNEASQTKTLFAFFYYLFFPGSCPVSLYLMYSTQFSWLVSKHIERGLLTAKFLGESGVFLMWNVFFFLIENAIRGYIWSGKFGE